ncbi:MAG TPA: glycosyltransferase family 4 protein [bacterium]|nr:glycosyltransferase family 4 protein [bacterium]
MKILIVNNEAQDHSDRIIHWEGNQIGFTRVGFEDILKNLWKPGSEPTVDRNAIDELVSDSLEADVVYCESPEALLLWYVLTRRGLRKVPIVMEDEDMLFTVSVVSGWIKKKYGENVLKEFLGDGSNVWLHHAKSQRKEYTGRGVPPERLVHMPCSSYYLSLLSEAAFEKVRDKSFSPELQEKYGYLRGGVVAAGVNQRDYATFVDAIEGIGIDAWVVSASCSPEVEASENVGWIEFVPIDEYVEILNLASVVVVPMFDRDHSGGENTTTFAMALGKPVIATETPGTREIITGGVNGVLVPPEDTSSLRSAIEKLINDEVLRGSIGKEAMAAEELISTAGRDALLKAFGMVEKTG